MTNFANKLTAIVATALLSTTMIGAAIGPASTGGTAVVSAARVA